MKFIFILMPVLFSFSTFAQDLSGTWEVVKRECTDGSQPADRFIIGKDQETFTFHSNTKSFYYRLDYLRG